MVKLGFISSQFANNLEMFIEKWNETESESETEARVNGTEKRILHFFEIHWTSIELGKPIVRANLDTPFKKSDSCIHGIWTNATQYGTAMVQWLQRKIWIAVSTFPRSTHRFSFQSRI